MMGFYQSSWFTPRFKLKCIFYQLVAVVVILTVIVAYERSTQRAGRSPRIRFNSTGNKSPVSHHVERELELKPLPMPLNVTPKSYIDIFGTTKIVQQVDFEFTIENNRLCGQSEVFLVTYIHSALDRRVNRERIRRTWASVTTVHGNRLVYFFLLGSTHHRTLGERVIQESHTFNDIVQGDFLDSYHNLTNKNLMGLKWISRFCSRSKYVLKVDDDTMVDPYHLVEFLSNSNRLRNTLSGLVMCSVMSHIGVPKDKLDKWHIPAYEYPYRYYPAYCEGFAYILSSDMPSKLYNISQYVPYFWIDDVYVTGFLLHRLKLKPEQFVRGHGANLMTPNIDVANYIFFLAKNSHYSISWDSTWKRVLMHNNLSIHNL